MDTLGAALPREIARIATKILPNYVDVAARVPSPGVTLTLNIIKADIVMACEAIAAGDIEQQLRCYQLLKAYEQ